MFSKHVIEKVVECQGIGLSAEETRKYLRDNYQIKISLNSVYNLRHGVTAQDIIDELIRRQERAIRLADSEDPALGLKYRNELLKILVPHTHNPKI